MLIDHDLVEYGYEISQLEAIIASRFRGSAVHREGEPAPDDPREWVQALFPKHAAHDFTERHDELWDWLAAMDEATAPAPFVGVWPRGGGKTTSAELGTTFVGVTGRRRYGWYVTETQQKADNNIRNLAALLESRSVERHYPAHAERRLTKYGHSKGWTSQRLSTAGGFTVDAIGLDTARRGLKVEDQRPDFIILDDVDGKHDSLATTAKKIDIITTSILPAGSSNCAVLAIQNLIIRDGFFTRMADGRADYLTDRIMSGPHPAVEGLEWEWQSGHDDVKTPVITKGKATWTGQSLEVCTAMMRRFGPIAFLKECQHQVKELIQGLVIRFDPTKHMQAWTDDELVQGIAKGSLVPFGGIDYGYWRFAFLLFVADRAGRIHVIDEMFSQREELTDRAKRIDDILTKYGITKLSVYGDPANPTDSAELNAALERGWGETKPKWRATAAVKDKGSRLTGPDKINDMLTRRSLLVRRGIGGKSEWHMGMNAASEGDPVQESRFVWEMDNWMYADPLEGQAQKPDPNDDTADGADMMAAFRYGIMSRLKPAKKPKPRPKKTDRNRDKGYERMAERIKENLQRGAA